jgi:lysozyme family protein
LRDVERAACAFAIVHVLQRAVGAADDGQIGPATLRAASASGPLAAARFNGARLKFMRDTPIWGQFGRGWADRIASNLLALKD